MLTVKINGKEVEVPQGTTILDAAKEAGVHIPVLCHDSRLNPFGACRVCLVEQVACQSFRLHVQRLLPTKWKL